VPYHRVIFSQLGAYALPDQVLFAAFLAYFCDARFFPLFQITNPDLPALLSQRQIQAFIPEKPLPTKGR